MRNSATACARRYPAVVRWKYAVARGVLKLRAYCGFPKCARKLDKLDARIPAPRRAGYRLAHAVAELSHRHSGADSEGETVAARPGLQVMIYAPDENPVRAYLWIFPEHQFQHRRGKIYTTRTLCAGQLSGHGPAHATSPIATSSATSNMNSRHCFRHMRLPGVQGQAVAPVKYVPMMPEVHIRPDEKACTTTEHRRRRPPRPAIRIARVLDDTASISTRRINTLENVPKTPSWSVATHCAIPESRAPGNGAGQVLQP